MHAAKSQSVALVASGTCRGNGSFRLGFPGIWPQRISTGNPETTLLILLGKGAWAPLVQVPPACKGSGRTSYEEELSQRGKESGRKTEAEHHRGLRGPDARTPPDPRTVSRCTFDVNR